MAQDLQSHPQIKRCSDRTAEAASFTTPVEGYVMKLRLCATACALALVAATASVEAQTRQPQRGTTQGNQNRQGSMQFDNNARQTTQDWYKQRQNHPPVGLRSQD